IRVVMLDYEESAGNIVLSDESGNEFMLSEQFSGIIVPTGTKVTVTAEAKEGYRFIGWTENASAQEGTSFTVEVTENLLIGAAFEAITHKVNYDVTAGSEGGFIVPMPYVNSGSSVEEGTELSFAVRAEEGYRIDKITLAKGDSEDIYTYPDEYKTMASGSIIVDADIDIKVEFSLCVCEGYEDVSLDDWYHDAAVFAIDHDLMNGMTETTFAPYEYATRAQIVTILYRIAGEPEVEGTSPFTDVEVDSWYEDAVIWAASEGIAKGVTTTLFAPNEYITREQMATFFYRYSEVNGYSLTTGADLSRFSDADEISVYALEPMDWAVTEGLIQGNGNGEICPGDNASRAQIATILERYVKTQIK
ncbi:MAG: S-layer homology domain-containing protein, partial [Firmicutes bacterium]|nr:S-layer homology domain-containing protein [Bacillota bacterium]